MHNALTVLNPNGKTFKICHDHEVNERNKFRTSLLVSEEKTRGLSRVFAECGTELSEFGLYKLENVYPEATSDILTGEMKSIEISEFSTPGSPTSTVQIVGYGGHIIKPEKLKPLLASRIAVSKSGKFGETTVITDNVKGQWYKGKGGKHRDFKFTHTIFHHGQKCFLLARVLEKTQGGKLKFFRESDGEEFVIDIKKGEFLIMMAQAGLCHHNCEEGLFTIVTDFVLPYDAIRREREGGVDGKFEQMIRNFAKKISQHL